MKKKRKIILGIVLAFLLLIFYMGYTLYRNITDIDKLNLIDCTDKSQHEFLATEDCLLYSLSDCVPATNYNGFNILGFRNDKCKVLIKNPSEEMFFCYFSQSSLNELKSVKVWDIETKLVDLISNLKTNDECNQVGYASMFFRRYWN
jgi:hypothetical protein